MPTLLKPTQVLFLAMMVTGAALVPAWAGDSASAWSMGSKSAARLIAAPGANEGAYRAGIEIKLAPETITYWRSPGESGVPPVFDFSRSSNLRSAVVSFPAPRRINEAGSDIFGYEGVIVLPVRVVPQEAGKSVDLLLDIDYAACEKICLPVHATLDLPLPPRDGGQIQAIAAAEAAVPRQLSREEIARDVAIQPVPHADKPTWRLRWSGSHPEDLFAESQDLFFIETKRDGEDFLVILTDHPKDAAFPDQPVRFTLTGARPVEFALHLDARAATP
jgi:DsbC/DsbD-like thiol-disulfide interchange protein